MDKKIFSKQLSVLGLDVQIFDTLDSTNKTAKALSDEKTQALVIAKEQTVGRGRLGRSFYSPKGGAYFSLLLRPKLSPQNALNITTAAAVAVCRAIEKLSNKNPQIKWVNDVFIDGKKVCGILCESAFSREGTKMDYAVLGVGANLFPPEHGFPEDIKHIADSIFEKPCEELYFDFIFETVNEFLNMYNSLEKADFWEEYKDRSFLIGKEISFIKNGENKTATVLDIEKSFGLVVKYKDGNVETLTTGEVTIGSGNVKT